MPELSIIIATLNENAVIGRCLESISKQTYADFQLIIMDGISTDGTVNIIDRYNHLYHTFESSSDNGIYSAWNKALHKATGDWVMFLGADDYLVNDNILNELMRFARVTSADLVTVRNAEIDSEGKQVKIYGEPWQWSRFKKYMNICHVGVLHRRTLFDEYGLFDEKYKIAGDYDFLMRVGDKLSSADFDRVVACCGNDGVSRSRVIEAFREAVKIQKNHNSNAYFLSVLRYSLSYLMLRAKLILKN